MVHSLLKNLRISCRQRNIPIISQETQEVLSNLLYKNKPKVCLEIGSAVGYSTIFIANILKQWDGIIYSMEISYLSYTEGLKNIKQSGLNNIVLYPFDVNKVDIQKLVNKDIEFAFIDGQKDQYANYLMKVWNMVSRDGIIVLDDVIKYRNKLLSLYRYLEKNQIYYKLIKTEPGDGIIVIE
ncbi:class I SAM-dependent methyltransferase [Candidatus Gracilibacteria bacterium]|nr:class I SAM-dependent methyltransferase [Candidatus Gracilibacteria bacterium]